MYYNGITEMRLRVCFGKSVCVNVIFPLVCPGKKTFKRKIYKS